jgi:hypothetical protein
VIDVYAKGEGAVKGAVEPFAAHAGKHSLQKAAVDAVVLVSAQFANVGEL